MNVNGNAALTPVVPQFEVICDLQLNITEQMHGNIELLSINGYQKTMSRT